MSHKLSNYDIEELMTAVSFIVRQAYDDGYTDGYTEGYHDACMKEDY